MPAIESDIISRDEEILPGIKSLSPPLALKSDTLELPNASDWFYFEIIPTHELTLPDIQPSSSNLTSSVHSKPISSTLETRHSSTPPLTYLLVTIDVVIYTVPSKKNYNILEDPVLLTLVIHSTR